MVPTVLDVHSGLTYSTIQSAVNAANPNDTLQVGAGVYQENVTINKSLTLLGPNAGINPNGGARGPEAIVEPATNDPTGGNVFSVEASGVTINGLTIDGSNPNLSGGVTLNGVNVNAANGVSNANTSIDHLVVRDDIIRNFNENGVLGDLTAVGAQPSGLNLITENLIDNIPALATSDGNVGRGVSLVDNFYASVTDNVLTRVRTGIQSNNFNLADPDTDPNAAAIEGNTITFYVRGIFDNLQYQQASPWTISNNDLTYIPLAATAGYNGGLFVFSIQDGASATIQNNNVTGARYGVELWNLPSTITVRGGTLANNQVGIWATNDDVNYGAGAATTAIVDGATITGSTSDGVLVESDPAGTATLGLAVQNSTIASGGVGVEVKGGLSSFVLTHDAIFGNQTGVVLDDDVVATSNDLVNNDAISGNTVAGLVHNGSGTLDATNDWWGSPTGPTHPANPGGVGQKIIDARDGANGGGIVNFTPFLTTSPLPASTTTTAGNATATFNSSNQNVTLTADVRSIAGPVNEGTVTFTLKQGSTVIGTAATSDTVRNGRASVGYVLPAGTAAGSYSIDAVYNPGADFIASSDTTHTFTVSPASTTTTASNVTATFSDSTQDVTLSATVSSGAGAVNEGTVTFTLKQGSTVLGTATTSGTVSNGQASVSYVLPAGTAAGTYSIDVVYNPGPDFTTSSDTTPTLTVTPASATIQFTSVTVVPNLFSLNQTETINVRISGPGVVSQGTVVFTVNGQTVSASVDGSGDAAASLTLPLPMMTSSQSIRAVFSGDDRSPADATQTAWWGPWNALLPSVATFAAAGGQSVQSFLMGLPLWEFLYTAQGRLEKLILGPGLWSWDFSQFGGLP
jgi:hypothetical protein